MRKAKEMSSFLLFMRKEKLKVGGGFWQAHMAVKGWNRKKNPDFKTESSALSEESCGTHIGVEACQDR